ncbi:DUF5708 family protein [Streptomyces sp. NPDC057702]|uniref:DUF5708 family protein n=1 Tax=unclassified Streptomyces TaxID=2593676 RepID=UPI0036CDE4ED
MYRRRPGTWRDRWPAGVWHLAEGTATLVVGLGLWWFTADVHTPVVTPRKVGVVLMAVGAAQVLIGVYGTATARGKR